MRRWIALAMVVGGCLGQAPSEELGAKARVLAAFAQADEVDVIVGFDDPAPQSIRSDRQAHRIAVVSARDEILQASGDGFVPTRVFDHVPAVAGRLTRAGLERLSRLPRVSYIQLDTPGHGALTVAVPAIGGDVAKNDFKLSGKGVRVAVLDTGIATTHPDLKASLQSPQHCFTHSACPPSNASEGTSAEDDHGHGSNVSGIITSDGVVAGAGFAPRAEIIAVKINDRNNAGFASDWAAGLDWVFANLSTLNVKIVNASLSTDALYASAAECDRSEPALAHAVKNLTDAGVVIFAASGNRGQTTLVSAPACNTGVIAVGATYKSDQGRQPPSGTYAGRWGTSFADCADETTAFDGVTCFTNSGPRLDVVAPGAAIVSDTLGGRTDTYRGTSQACPAAAGVAALMLECDPTLRPADIKDILVRTGVTVTDGKNGRTFPSIRAAAAVGEACAKRGGLDAGADAAPRDTSAEGADVRADALVGIGGASGGSSGQGGSTGSGGTVAGTGGSTSSGGSAGLRDAGPVDWTGGVLGRGGAGAGGAALSSGGVAGNAVGGEGGAPGSGGTTPAATGGASAPTSEATGGSSARAATGGAITTTATQTGCSCRMGSPASTGRNALLLPWALFALGLIRGRRRAWRQFFLHRRNGP